MKAKLSEHKGLITLFVALAAALYSHYVEPIPQVNEELWDATLTLAGVAGAVHAGQKVGLREKIDVIKQFLKAKDVIQEQVQKDKEANNDAGNS